MLRQNHCRHSNRIFLPFFEFPPVVFSLAEDMHGTIPRVSEWLRTLPKEFSRDLHRAVFLRPELFWLFPRLF